jgi:hypothetical protein
VQNCHQLLFFGELSPIKSKILNIDFKYYHFEFTLSSFQREQGGKPVLWRSSYCALHAPEVQGEHPNDCRWKKSPSKTVSGSGPRTRRSCFRPSVCPSDNCAALSCAPPKLNQIILILLDLNTLRQLRANLNSKLFWSQTRRILIYALKIFDKV